MQYLSRLVGSFSCAVLPSPSGAAEPDTEPGPDMLTRARPIGGRVDTAPSSSMLPLTGPGPLTADLAASLLPRLPPGVVRELRVRVDAEASAFALIWWRNAMWVLLSGGLAAPWARAANRRWLLRHTRVGGHALNLAVPLQTLWVRDLLGLALLAGVLGALAGDTVWAAAAALLVAGLVMPTWLHLRLVDDLARVTWADRRLAFDGSLLALYAVVGPALGVLAGLVGAGLAWCTAPPPSAAVGAVAWGAIAAVALAGLPGLWWRWLAYRQQHLRLGPLSLSWRGPKAAFWQLGLRTLVWASVAAAGVAGALCVVWAFAVMLLDWRLKASGLGWATVVWLGGSACLVWPFLTARLQNLAWNHTGCRHLRFRSKLAAGPYVRLHAKHLVLVVLTGGLYWPWAVFHAWRARMEALSVRTRIEPEVLAAHWPEVRPGQ